MTVNQETLSLEFILEGEGEAGQAPFGQILRKMYLSYKDSVESDTDPDKQSDKLDIWHFHLTEVVTNYNMGNYSKAAYSLTELGGEQAKQLDLLRYEPDLFEMRKQAKTSLYAAMDTLAWESEQSRLNSPEYEGVGIEEISKLISIEQNRIRDKALEMIEEYLKLDYRLTNEYEEKHGIEPRTTFEEIRANHLTYPSWQGMKRNKDQIRKKLTESRKKFGGLAPNRSKSNSNDSSWLADQERRETLEREKEITLNYRFIDNYIHRLPPEERE